MVRDKMKLICHYEYWDILLYIVYTYKYNENNIINFTTCIQYSTLGTNMTIYLYIYMYVYMYIYVYIWDQVKWRICRSEITVEIAGIPVYKRMYIYNIHVYMYVYICICKFNASCEHLGLPIRQRKFGSDTRAYGKPNCSL